MKASTERDVVVAARNVTVDFPGTRAVNDVSLEIRERDVLAVVGANGSGKTTLLSVLCGLRRPTSGTLLDSTGEIEFRAPIDALRKGFTLVPQEPQLAGTMSCQENVLLGHDARLGLTGLRRKQAANAATELRQALPHIDPAQRAGTLRKADRAVLGLVIALARRPRLLALDEPTAVLGESAVDVVRGAVEQVRETRGAVVLVSHRLRDIVQLANRVVVLVDGKLTFESDQVADLTVEELVDKIVHGRAPATPPEALASTLDAAAEHELGETCAEIRNLVTDDGLHVPTLKVRAGDIVGLAGLGGSGRSRLLRVVAGARAAREGEILVDGTPLKGGIRNAREAGVAYVPEDRVADGIFPPLSVAQNLTMQERVSSRALISTASTSRERKLSQSLVERFGIRAPHLTALVTALSGGNQQRVVLARALGPNTRLLVADEPTQGVDVQGRAEIQGMLRAFAKAGGAILLASSDFDELLDLCNRLVVMRDGVVLGEVAPHDTDYRSLVALTSGAEVAMATAGSLEGAEA